MMCSAELFLIFWSLLASHACALHNSVDRQLRCFQNWSIFIRGRLAIKSVGVSIMTGLWTVVYYTELEYALYILELLYCSKGSLKFNPWPGDHLQSRVGFSWIPNSLFRKSQTLMKAAGRKQEHVTLFIFLKFNSDTIKRRDESRRVKIIWLLFEPNENDTPQRYHN